MVRPQGTAFLVEVPTDAPPRAEDAPSTHHDAPGTRHQEPAGTTGLAAVLLPLVAQLGAAHERIERQASEIAALRDERGRQSAELERATSTMVALHDELAGHRRRVRLLSIALAALCALALVAGTLAVAAGTAPAWVR